MERRSIRILPLLLTLTACTSKSADDQSRSSHLAGELVACQNDRSGMREELAQAKNDLAQAQAKLAEQATTIQQQQQQQQRAGRTPSRRQDGFAHEVPGSRPRLYAEAGGPGSADVEQHEAQEVAQLLRGNAGQLRVCYEKGLKRNSSLQFVTQVKVQLTVDQTGHARQVQISPRSGQDMEDCMRQVITGWQFPSYRGNPVVVEQPVSLKVKD